MNPYEGIIQLLAGMLVMTAILSSLVGAEMRREVGISFWVIVSPSEFYRTHRAMYPRSALRRISTWCMAFVLLLFTTSLALIHKSSEWNQAHFAQVQQQIQLNAQRGAEMNKRDR